MREIEFNYIYQHDETGRSIDKRYNIEDIENFEFNDDIIGYSLIARRQYTGLLDKQGVKVYEGDIVKGSAYGKEIYTGVVEFYDASFVMRIDGNKGYYRLNKMTFQELEVIGNIYEHNIQEKYNLDGDKEDVQKAIKLIRELENRTCDSCWFYDDDCKVCTNDSVFGMDEDLKRTGAFSTLPNFSCNRWEQK